MPTLTFSKSITYTEPGSGASFNITTTKVKTGKHGYRQVMTCQDGVDRRLIQIGANPSYTKLSMFTVRNVGDYDAKIKVVSGGGNISIPLPPGRTFDLFNTNHWNDDSATDPDTIDEIIGIGDGGDAILKFDALFS